MQRTRPDATTGDRNPKAMNIKGPVMRHISSSDKSHDEEEVSREVNSVATEKPLELMQSREKMAKKKNEMGWRVINIQHVTLNHTAKLANLCMAIGTKSTLA